MSSKFYLGKAGQCYGPYAEAQVQQLEKNGQIGAYTWIWDDKNPGWLAVDPPPPPPTQQAVASVTQRLQAAREGAPAQETPPETAVAAPVMREAAVKETAVKETAPKIPPRPPVVQAKAEAPAPRQRAPKAEPVQYYDTDLKAICRNHQSAVSGKLLEVTDEGCEVLSDMQSPTPLLPGRGQAVLNLFDEKSGKSANVAVEILGVSRVNGNWAYHVHWASFPELIGATAV